MIFTGARNNALDMAALTARGIPVSYTESGPSKASTCELTWSLILAASKRLPNAVLTPHLGFVNVPVFEKFFAGVVANLQAWLAGTPRHVLNPEVLRS